MMKKITGMMIRVTLALALVMGTAVLDEIIPITPDSPSVIAQNDPPLPWSHIIVIG